MNHDVATESIKSCRTKFADVCTHIEDQEIVRPRKALAHEIEEHGFAAGIDIGTGTIAAPKIDMRPEPVEKALPALGLEHSANELSYAFSKSHVNNFSSLRTPWRAKRLGMFIQK